MIERWDKYGIYRIPAAVSNAKKLGVATNRKIKCEKRYTGKLNIVVCNRCDTPKESTKKIQLRKHTTATSGEAMHVNNISESRLGKESSGIFRISVSHFPFGNILQHMQPCL